MLEVLFSLLQYLLPNIIMVLIITIIMWKNKCKLKTLIFIWVIILFNILIYTLFLFFVGQRAGTGPDIPYGKWHSDEPNITFDLKPHNDNMTDEEYLNGTYIKNGEIIEVNVDFYNHLHIYFIIQPLAKDRKGERVENQEKSYFYGYEFKIKGDKLYCYPAKKSIKKTGYKKIVFDLVEEYGK